MIQKEEGKENETLEHDGLDLTNSCGSEVTDCWQSPRDVYIWGNTFDNMTTDPDCATGDDGNCLNIVDKGTGCLRENYEYYTRAPQVGDPRVTSYTKYPYPHPLASDGDRPSRPMNLRVIVNP